VPFKHEQTANNQQAQIRAVKREPKVLRNIQKIKKLFLTRLFLENSRSTNRYTIYNAFMKKIKMNISCFSF